MAPPFIACTVIGMSPCPVMKMIGSSLLRRRELSLKIKTALTGQSHVENQAGGPIRRIGFEKVGNGRKELSVDADRPQQTSNRRSKIGIIVNNQDGGVRVRHRYDPRLGTPGMSLIPRISSARRDAKLVPSRGHEQCLVPTGGRDAAPRVYPFPMGRLLCGARLGHLPSVVSQNLGAAGVPRAAWFGAQYGIRMRCRWKRS